MSFSEDDVESSAADNEIEHVQSFLKMLSSPVAALKRQYYIQKEDGRHVIDSYSRVLFPTTFILFNIIYMAVCVSSQL